MRNFLIFFVWLWPCSGFKNLVLNILGHKIAANAKAHPNFVFGVKEFLVEDGAFVGALNFFRNMKSIRLARHSYLGKRNQINSHPAFNKYYESGGELVLGEHAKVTNLHWLDCSAGVFIGAFSSVAGRESILMSHSVDLASNTQRGRPIRIDEYVFIAVRCTLLSGAHVPPRSVIGAGAIVVGELVNNGPGYLYCGSPAKPIKKIDGEWFERGTGHTLDLLSIDGNKLWANVI